MFSHVVRKSLTFAAAAACLMAAPAAMPSTASADRQGATGYVPGRDFVPRQLAVQFEGREAPTRVRLPRGASVPEALDRLRRRGDVDYAVREYLAEASAWLPDDPGVRPQIAGEDGGWQAKQWNFRPCGSLCGGPPADTLESLGGIDAPTAWRNLRNRRRGGAKGVRVAVLDTGVAYRGYGRTYRQNPDLRRSRFLPGWDFVDGDALPLDLNGHGTHVAGTIAGATDNGVAMTGLAYASDVIPVRVLDADGFGTASDVAKGIRFAAARGARVIGMSFNFPCKAPVPQIRKAVRYAHARGAVLVGSTGNAGSERCASAPSTLPRVIAVGASTAGGCRAGYSLGGVVVDLAAPGGGYPAAGCPTLAALPIFQLTFKAHDPRFFSLPAFYEGTSMAAAHVTGGAAMVIASGVLGRRPSPEDVLRRLRETARPPAAAGGTPAGRNLGAGIMDLGRATAPGA